MTIHIWMHWFWITLFYKGLVVLSTPIILSPSVVEAGLQYDDTDFNLFDNNFNDYKSSLETSQIEDTYPPKKRHIEDGADLPEESSYPTSSPSAAEAAAAAAAEEKIGTLRTNEASASGTDFRDSDFGDTYNGGPIDIFHHQYPVKKYSKYAELNTSKFGKSKTMPKTSDGSVPKEKNVKILKIIEEKIDIKSDKIFNVSLDNSSVSSENDTEETTDLPESITTVVMFNNSSNNNSGESHNETTSSSSTSSSTVEESNEESILSDEPIKNDQITENIVKSNKGTTKNRLNFNLTTAAVTEDQNNVVQNESEIVVENKVEETVVHPTVEPFSFNNRVAAATSSENKERLNQSGLDAGSITGITLGIVVISGLFGAISFVLYRRRYLNKPQALNDKSSNLDSSGYIDDTSFRENSEEMYSLDNDSFLNSLEAMTIQNYWTENVKHTKL